MDLTELIQLEGHVVHAAREELLSRFNAVTHSYKDDGSLLTEADLVMDRRLRRELAERWPEVAFLSEEMSAQDQRRLLQESDRALWCLDPLDGTNNFAAGLPAFTVSLALIHRGEPRLGVIYDPIRDEAFRAIRGGGAWLNGEPLMARRPHRALRHAMALIDLKRLDTQLAVRLIRQRPFGSQRNFGSCALEWAWLAAGRAHLCLHGGQKLWDYAAGALILSEAGGRSCTLEGEPVFRADLSPRSVVSSLDQELFGAWCDWLGVGVSRSAPSAAR
jgi:myo-inositol-1(or 4)-monophosphatase